MHNFQLTAQEILQTYPVNRVKEIHISGGSWSEIAGQSVRRDTHDHEIPTAGFELLAVALQYCHNVESIIVERLGHTLKTEAEKQEFREQFYRIRQIVSEHRLN